MTDTRIREICRPRTQVLPTDLEIKISFKSKLRKNFKFCILQYFSLKIKGAREIKKTRCFKFHDLKLETKRETKTIIDKWHPSKSPHMDMGWRSRRFLVFFLGERGIGLNFIAFLLTSFLKILSREGRVLSPLTSPYSPVSSLESP